MNTKYPNITQLNCYESKSIETLSGERGGVEGNLNPCVGFDGQTDHGFIRLCEISVRRRRDQMYSLKFPYLLVILYCINEACAAVP